jgi:Ca-activated chloride channel family protein
LGSEAKPATALEAAERADVILYSVAVIDAEFYSDRGMGFHGNSVLKKLSAATGGRMSRVSDAHSTTAAFGQISKELRGQYLLGYTPSKQGDGSFRTIDVQVRSGHWKVRARRGYYSRPE